MADQSAVATLALTMQQGGAFSAVIQLFEDADKTIRFDCTGKEIDIEIREGVADSGAPVVLSASTRATGEGAGKLRWLSYLSDGTVDTEGEGDASEGVFAWDFTAEDTVKLKPSKKPRKGDRATAEFLYDAEVSSTPLDAEPILKGTITVELEVTRRT